MALALLPILAQALSVSAGDRSEVRHVITEEVTWQDAQTVPYASVALDNRRSSLRLTYNPSFLFARFNRPEHELLVFHNAALVGTTKLNRRMQLTLSQGAGYGEQNFRLTTISANSRVTPQSQNRPPADNQNPTQPGTGGTGGAGGTTTTPGGAAGVPGTGTIQPTLPAQDQTFDFVLLRTQAALSYTFSRRATLTGAVGYDVTGGVGRRAQLTYPRYQGPDAAVFFGYDATSRDRLTSSVRVDYLRSGAVDSSFLTGAAEQAYLHRFTKNISAGASVGLMYTRLETRGQVRSALYPIFGVGSGAGFQYETRLADGTFTVNLNVGYAPVLDTVSNAIDPRLISNLRAAYVRRQLTVYAGGLGVVSLRPNDSGALNSIVAEAGVRQGLPAGFGVDGGVRAIWQSYEKRDLIPLSYVLFLGLSWDAPVYRD